MSKKKDKVYVELKKNSIHGPNLIDAASLVDWLLLNI